MKRLKISKPGWLILATGIFIVALAALGVTRISQIKTQETVTANLAASQVRLDQLDASELRVQEKNLTQQLADIKQGLAEVKSQLHQEIDSVEVTDQLYKIAAEYSVNVTVIGSTLIGQDNYEGVKCSVISLSAMVEGVLSDIIGFISGLNNDFSTGFVRSAQLKIAEAPLAGLSSASINLTVYSYDGG